MPDGVGGRFSILSPVGLLPAAILGLDVVELLEGAAAMNEHFRTAPVGRQCRAAVRRCLPPDGEEHATPRFASCRSGPKHSKRSGCGTTSCWPKAWASSELGATPITAVNTRDLHSRAQQHQEGRLDKLHTNLIVDQLAHRSAGGRIAASLNQDELNKHADKTLPEIMAAAIAGTNQAYREGGRPTANLHLPQVDEYYLGQFFQMMMLATVVEGRLIGINPYGQPGVEAYKKNMNRILAEERP